MYFLGQQIKDSKDELRSELGGQIQKVQDNVQKVQDGVNGLLDRQDEQEKQVKNSIAKMVRDCGKKR